MAPSLGSFLNRGISSRGRLEAPSVRELSARRLTEGVKNKTFPITPFVIGFQTMTPPYNSSRHGKPCHPFCESGNPFVCFADISPNRGISFQGGQG